MAISKNPYGFSRGLNLVLRSEEMTSEMYRDPKKLVEEKFW
jgi:hypothetical protein